jgi:hypothetical protein
MQVAPAAARPPGPRLGDLASRIAAGARALAVDYARLAVLDARRAAITLAWLLSAGVVAALLVVTAWLALVAGGIVWLLGSGASWLVALASAAGLNLLAAVAVGLWLRSAVFGDEPLFAATLRQLDGDRPAEEFLQ